MKEGLFHFKEFSVSHFNSSMKVGVDAVLLGSWVTPAGNQILDVGTGCGVIALMLAQRNRNANILGIDIHGDSINEAKDNFSSSPWNIRMSACLKSYSELISECRDCFDLIVSNPPFFDSGVNEFNNARMAARHQGLLSPEIIILNSSSLLKSNGRLGMIVPSEFFSSLRDIGISSGLTLSRAMFVKDHPSSAIKRVLLEFMKKGSYDIYTSVVEEEVPVLTMFDKQRNPTEEYRKLGHDFYLKF